MLGRGPLVLGAILLDAAVLGGLVLLTTRAAGRVAALLALDVRVRSVAATRPKVSATSQSSQVRGNSRAAETVLGGDTLVGCAVHLETVVLRKGEPDRTKRDVGGGTCTHLGGLVLGRHDVWVCVCVLVEVDSELKRDVE